MSKTHTHPNRKIKLGRTSVKISYNPLFRTLPPTNFTNPSLFLCEKSVPPSFLGKFQILTPLSPFVKQEWGSIYVKSVFPKMPPWLALQRKCLNFRHLDCLKSNLWASVMSFITGLYTLCIQHLWKSLLPLTFQNHLWLRKYLA